MPPAAASPINDHKYSPRIAFHLFVISNHNQYNPRDEQNFNYEEFKKELLKFRLPSQVLYHTSIFYKYITGIYIYNKINRHEH